MVMHLLTNVPLNGKSVWSSCVQSYLCSPHARCTFWQSWARTCSPAGTDWSDCSQTPDLWMSKHTRVSAGTYSNRGGYIHMWEMIQNGACAVFYLWCSPCLGQPDKWADVSGTSWASSWFSSGLMSPCLWRSSSLRKTSRIWEYFFKTLISYTHTECCERSPSVSPLFFLESRWSFSLSCFSAPGDSGMSSSMASSDSQAWRTHTYCIMRYIHI